MAKRHGGLWQLITSRDNFQTAYHKAIRGKGRMQNIVAFAKDAPGNIEKVRNLLLTKQFRTSPYQRKVITEPKRREIFVLPFSPDRIVQHALMNVVEPIWDKMMIFDSYACRIGKGQHAGSQRAMEFVRSYKYCLQCDVAKFYPSINHDVLAGIVRKKVKCPETLWLLDDIIYSYPGGCNTPIGNYTSQWFGNLYLNELDVLVKQDLKVKGYLRYCDDFLLFGDDKSLLHRMKELIGDFLRDRLRLSYSYAEVFPVKSGVDFLGYRHFPTHVLLRKSTALRVKRRLAKLPHLLATGRLSKEQVRSSLASTKGWLRWACTHNLKIALQLEQLEALCA
jgi:hypothetical protein